MIVFGYDGSEDAQRAIAAASALMRGRGLVVHVWEPVPDGAAPAVASPGVAGAGLSALADAGREIEAEARALVEDGARLATEAGFEVEPVLIRGEGGGAWRDLLRVAEERGGTVVVVGRRGISRLRSALLGSVSDGAVKHAHVPVLVVPPPSAP
jgi:nucleotide-binding universal stress UspA family protein